MTTPDPKLLDKLHPPVKATTAMPAGRVIALVGDPSGRLWEVVLHEAEHQYTVRTPPGFEGEGDSGLMFRTDFATIGYLTHEFGIKVPPYVLKAIRDGRSSKGWEPGVHVFSTIANIMWALPVRTLVEKLVNEDEFAKLDGASSTKVEVKAKPWWQRAADKLGAAVKRRGLKAPCPVCGQAVELKPGDTIPSHDAPPPPGLLLSGKLCDGSLLTVEAAAKLKGDQA